MNRLKREYLYWKGRLHPPHSEVEFAWAMGAWRWVLGMKHQRKVRLFDDSGGYYVLDYAVERFGRRLAIEIDGPHHRDILQVMADREREKRLLAAGWSIFRIPVEGLKDPQLVRRETLRFFRQVPRDARITRSKHTPARR